MGSRSFAVLARSLTTETVFRLLPPLAHLAWLKLAAAMIQQRLTVLRFGSYILSAAEIAAFAGLTEPEWETYAPILLRFGLLSLDEDGATGCPALSPARPRVSSEGRANASRVNGCKGGRPRKRPDPAQREAMMPIAGGQVASSLRPKSGSAETCQVSQVSPAIAKLESSNLRTKLAVSNADMNRVGHAAAAAAGLQGQGHFGAARQWLAAGATEELILSTIDATMRLGRRPEHLGYFTKAILEALDNQPAASAIFGDQPTTSRHSKKFEAWNRAYEDWLYAGKQGPLPAATSFADDGTRIAA